MSADNWTTCKHCKDTRRADHDFATADLRKRIADDYGKVPLEEWEEARRQLADLEAGIAFFEKSEANYFTFREDWEIDGAETGTVTVTYWGRCSVCGYGVKFTHEQPCTPKGRP